MSEFDQANWKRGQSEQAAQDRKHAAKMAALSKAAAGGSRRGSGSRSSFKKAPAARATRGQGSWTSRGKTPPLILKINGGGAAGDGYAERQKGAQAIDSTMLGRDAAERSAEWRLDAVRHPRVDPKNLMVHVSLSRPAGQDLTPDQWQKVAGKFLEKIGADGCQFVCTRHTNTSNDHLHLIFSRARPDGTLVSNGNNRWTWRAALRETEKELGITAAERPADRPAATSDSQVNAARRAQRRGTKDSHIDPATIGQVLAQASTPEQFAAGLQAAGIHVKPAEKNGRTTGLLFQKNGADEWLAGSSISREFSLQKVQLQIELNRQMLLKKEQDLLAQRQREAVARQRQAQAQQHPRERY